MFSSPVLPIRLLRKGVGRLARPINDDPGGRAVNFISLGILLQLAATAISPATAQVQSDNKIGIMLSNLPPQGSLEYEYLRDISGAVGGEQLPMSGKEMWLIDASRADMFVHAHTELDVQVRQIRDDFNEVMIPAPDTGKDHPLVRRVVQSDLFNSVTLAKLNTPGMVEYALGRGNKPQIGSQRAPTSPLAEIEIPIGPTETIRAKRLSVYTMHEGCYWHGEIGDSGTPVNLMWWPDGRMAGAFHHNGKDYVIRHIEDHTHAVIELHPHMMPPDHPIMPEAHRDRYRPDRRGGLLRAPVEDLQNLEDAGDASQELPEEFAKLLDFQQPSLSPLEKHGEDIEITVLFAYTKNAASHYTDIHNDVITLAVEQTNQSFRNSKIDDVTVKIVHSYLTEYDETDHNLFDHLWRFADKGDRFMEEVHRLRDEKNADVAVLIVDNQVGCGLATRVAAFEDEAFAAVNHHCATASFSLAHEIGHLIGARHDRSLDKSTKPFPFGHGYANATKWRTMMAYKSSCNGCVRLPLWSSPDVEVEGESAGDLMTHNARVIREQAARVAAFR